MEATIDPTIDQAPEGKAAPAKPKDDVLDTLQPKAAVKAWKIGPPDMQFEFVQRPLSFLTKMEWFALVGDIMDRAMSGPNGLTVGNLFATPTTRDGVLRAEDFRDADTFVHAVGKLISYAPDFLEKSFCIWLDVPDFRRETVIELMKRPEEEGGLSDDAGMEIMEIFIDQNYEAIHKFFTERVGKLRSRVEARQAARQPA